MRKRVFLIDDDRDDREIFMEALATVDESCNCVTAENGEDALQKLTSDGYMPDVIFLDLNMPRMNGRECLIKIKDLHKFRQVPVIIYTTSSVAREKDELEKLGASLFLTKPANFLELCHSIQRVLKSNGNFSECLAGQP